MGRRLRLPGGRDVTATLDNPEPDRVVVACPPHPQMGGDRRDSRLRAVSDALAEYDIACLRFDYGPWDEGRGERADARNALAWAHERYAHVGLFGYSFGGGIAILAAADTAGTDDAPAAVSALSPVGRLGEEGLAPSVDGLDCPLQVVYGERDDTVDSVPVAERARELDHAVESLPADHFLVGQRERAADLVATFLDSSV